MILIIAVLAILLFISCVGLFVLNNGVKEVQEHWHSELAVSSKLRNEKHHEWERAEVLEQQVISLKQDIADIHASFRKEFPDNPFGSHASWYSSQPATSQTYYLTFCLDSNGQKIMNDLEKRFKKNPFTHDERETCRLIGRAEVYDFILNRINNSQNPNYSEQLEIAYMSGQLEQNND